MSNVDSLLKEASESWKVYPNFEKLTPEEFFSNYFAARSPSPFFLIVRFSGTELLVDCSSHRKKTIKELTHFLEDHLSDEFCNRSSIAEVRAHGIRLPGDVNVNDILNSMNVVECIDQIEFNKRNYQQLEASISEVSREDYKDSAKKFVNFGKQKQGKIYFRFGVGNGYRRLSIYSLSELKSMKEGKIAAVVDEAGWYEFLEFSRESPQSFRFKVSIKSTTDKNAAVWAIPVSVKHGKFEFGSVEEVSIPNEEDEEFVDYSTFYSLPAIDEKSGGDIPIEDPPTPHTHQSEGESPIEMQLSENFAIDCNQDVCARDGFFHNYFTLSSITFINTSEQIAGVVSTKMDYYDGSAWKPCEMTRIGETFFDRWGRNYAFNESGTNFNIFENSTSTLAVQGSIKVNGSPGSDNSTRARAHKSLPQPLKLRVTIEDSEKRKRSIIAEQVNPPKNIPTKESLGKGWSVSIKDFVSCDNTDADERIWVATYLQGKKVVIRYSFGTYFTLDKSHFKTMEFNAREKKLSEEYKANMSKKESSNEWKTTLLFDPEHDYRVYGLKLELKTATSRLVERIPLPQFNPADFRVSVKTNPSQIKAGSSLTAHIDVKTDVTTSDWVGIVLNENKESGTAYISGAYIYNAEKKTVGDFVVDIPSNLDDTKTYVVNYVNGNNDVLATSKTFTLAK